MITKNVSSRFKQSFQANTEATRMNAVRPTLIFSNHSHHRSMAELVGTGYHTLYLIIGYLRRHCTLKLPASITCKVVAYFDSAFYWHLNSRLLHSFRAMQTNGKQLKVVSSAFKIQSVSLDVVLCPNGVNADTQGCLIPYIHVKHMPNSVHSLIVCYEVYCIQTQSAFKCVDTIRHRHQFLTWPSHTLFLAEALKTDALDFIIIVDVLKTIKRRQFMKYRLSPCRLRSSCVCCYQWTVAAHNLSSFKHCPFKLFFCSPNFADNTWFIYAYPRYHEKNAKYIGLFLGLQLLWKPWYVDSVYADITVLQISGTQQIFNYKRKIWNNARLDFFKCDVDSPLTFAIKIRILHICTSVSNPVFLQNAELIAKANIFRCG